MEKKLDLILSELHALNTRVNSIESGQKEINQIVTAIRDRQEETDAKLEAISMDVHKIHGEVTKLKEGQDRQDRILESLALHSLEQETIIRELKRIK